MNDAILSETIQIKVLPFIKTKWEKAFLKKAALIWYVRKTIAEVLTNDDILKTVVAQYENEKENSNIQG